MSGPGEKVKLSRMADVRQVHLQVEGPVSRTPRRARGKIEFATAVDRQKPMMS